MPVANGDGRKPLDPFECVLCLVHGRLQRVAGDLMLEARVLARIAQLVAEWPSRTDVFVRSYEYLESLLGGVDLYADRKRRLNEAGLSVARRLPLGEMSSAEISGLMASANGVDISMPGYRPDDSRVFKRLGDQPYWLGLGHSEFERLLAAAETLVLVLDNAGEAAVDIAAARELAERAGAELVLVARERPYEVDVTLQEAAALADVLAPEARLIGTGGRLPVFHPRASSEARSLLRGHGKLVLVKGIANLEAFMDYPWSVSGGARAVFLLRAKCTPLARLFDVALAEPVVVSDNWVRERLKEGS